MMIMQEHASTSTPPKMHQGLSWKPSKVRTHLHSWAPQRWQQHSPRNSPNSTTSRTKMQSDVWPIDDLQRLRSSNHGLHTHTHPHPSASREAHKVDLRSLSKTMNDVDASFCLGYLFRFNVCWALGPLASWFEFGPRTPFIFFVYLFYRVFKSFCV